MLARPEGDPARYDGGRVHRVDAGQPEPVAPSDDRNLEREHLRLRADRATARPRKVLRPPVELCVVVAVEGAGQRQARARLLDPRYDRQLHAVAVRDDAAPRLLHRETREWE